MTPEMPREGSAPREDGGLSRRDLLRAAAAGAGLAAVPLLGTTPVLAQARRHAAADAGKLVIGAFEDGAITAFKKIIPLFKQQTGISIQLLTAPYDSFNSKAFQDGQSKAGQYDIYIMDDPWIRSSPPRASSRTSASTASSATPASPSRSSIWATGRRARGRASRASRTRSPRSWRCRRSATCRR